MINSVYGKSMENLQKRISVWLVTNEKYFLKYVSRLTYITHKSFDKYVAAIHEIKLVLILTNLYWIHCSRIKQMVDVWFPLQLY